MNDIIKSIPEGDNLIIGLGSQIFKAGTTQGVIKGDGKKFLIVLLAASLFLVVATEPFKLLLRKNIGKKSISILGIISVSIFYLLCACGMIGLINEFSCKDSLEYYPLYFQYLLNPYMLFSGIVSYLIFVIFILVRGIKEYKLANRDTNNDPAHISYRGTSVILGNLNNEGWAQKDIWYKAEPKTCFKVTLILTLLHPVIGIPMLFTTFSFWINERYHVKKLESGVNARNGNNSELSLQAQ